MKVTTAEFLLIWLILTVSIVNSFSQQFASSPSVWMYPNGNPQGTRYQPIRSSPQEIEKFVIKWKNRSIAGDVQVLVGNIIKDSAKIDDDFPYSPNEIVAAVGGKIILIDGKGFTHKTNSFGFQYVKNVSVLFDTLSTTYYPNPTSNLVIGLETIEFENQKDTLLFTYLAGYDSKADTIALLKRLVLDMREYKPNIFGSMKPFFGRRLGNDFLVYGTTNTFKVQANDTNPTKPPFFRGFSVFPSNNVLYTFPMPDITDNSLFRVTLGPEISFSPPSIFLEGGNFHVAIPNSSSISPNVNIPCVISLDKTNPTKSYLLCYTLLNNQIRQKFPPLELNSILDRNGIKPRIRPLFVTLNNSSTADSLYILVAEEYSGMDSSLGQSRLHLFLPNGNALTLPNDIFSPSFLGRNNHLWAIAVGNLDGISTNAFIPNYPNNPGNEIVVTYSSKFSSVPNNKLLVLRYNTGNPIPKPNPPNSFLYPFDTICTANISGWIAAVNDLDAAPDGKDEILLIDASRLLVLQMRDYNSFDFKMGKPLDTLLIKEFFNETIMDAFIVDIEGDGKNDILVQTNNSIYLLGSPLPKLIEVQNPIFDESTIKEYCYADTLAITLKSKSKSEITINIRFIPKINNLYDFKSSLIISQNVRIDKETTLVLIPVSFQLLGKNGIIYIENAQDPTQIFDSTGIFQFNSPTIIFDTLIFKQTDVYRNATISFTSVCIDTLTFQYSLDKNQWFQILQIINPQSNETKNLSFPCPRAFDYFAPTATFDFPLKAIFSRFDKKDTSQIFYKKVKPETFAISYDTTSTLCCTKYFSWNINSCDTVSILFSLDGGTTFRKVADVPASKLNYTFEQQRGFPELINFRFICADECLVCDTTLYISQPRIINSVAPNPFNPFVEQLEISFILQKDTDLSIKIIDQANRIVKKLIESVFRTKDTYYCIYWDGKTENNRIADPGLYYILLETSDGIQEIFPIFVK